MIKQIIRKVSLFYCNKKLLLQTVLYLLSEMGMCEVSVGCAPIKPQITLVY